MKKQLFICIASLIFNILMRILVWVFAIIGFVSLFTGCDIMPKTDEEKIEERIYALEKAYNDGDLKAFLNCMTNKQRVYWNSMFSLMQGIGGALGGFQIDLSAIWGLSVAASGSEMEITLYEVEIYGDTAEVLADIVFNQQSTPRDRTVISMEKEDGDWFVSDMQDAPLEDISVTVCYAFA